MPPVCGHPAALQGTASDAARWSTRDYGTALSLRSARAWWAPARSRGLQQHARSHQWWSLVRRAARTRPGPHPRSGNGRAGWAGRRGTCRASRAARAVTVMMPASVMALIMPSLSLQSGRTATAQEQPHGPATGRQRPGAGTARRRLAAIPILLADLQGKGVRAPAQATTLPAVQQGVHHRPQPEEEVLLGRVPNRVPPQRGPSGDPHLPRLREPLPGREDGPHRLLLDGLPPRSRAPP